VRQGWFVRVLVVVNTLSGGGDAGLYDYVRALGTRGAEVTLRFFDGARSLEEFVADGASFDRIVAAGGDGTVSAVCYALRGSGLPILVYPAGTANLLALNLDMPVEPRALADVTLNGAQVGFDLGELERRGPDESKSVSTGFTIMAGAGFDAALMEAALPLKSTIGAAAYLVAAVTNLAPTHSRFEIDLDGEMISTDGIACLLVNFGRLQFDLPVAQGADPRDGRFEVAVVRGRNVAALLPAVVAGFSGAEKMPGIDVYSASSVKVSAYPQMRVQYDGEVLDTLTPFAARILPLAATLLLPEDSPYASS
jgi:diacylglycerol kinase family enzyme